MSVIEKSEILSLVAGSGLPRRRALAQTKDFFRTLSPSDLDKVVEGTPFQPPPTVGMSIIGLLSDGMQHTGQAAYVRGLRQGMGWH